MMNEHASIHFHGVPNIDELPKPLIGSAMHNNQADHSEDDTDNQIEPSTTRTEKLQKRKLVRKPTTHIRLQNRGLRSIPSVITCSSLKVLYLYNNRIGSIQNLESLNQLTHLYLSHNNIQRLENISSLANLQKLYIGHNKISVLEGLEGLHNLHELHMESQRLPTGDALSFDPRSIEAVRGSLKILDIGYNKVTSLRPLSPLCFLSDLLAAGNQLTSLMDMKETLVELQSLVRLEIKGNPLCDLHRYRDCTVEGAPVLQRLDGQDVSAVYRQFLSGRGAVVARRLSSTQRLPAVSASADVIKEGGPIRLMRAVHSQSSVLAPRPAVARSGARRASTTHLRVGNMLTLTPARRALVRAGAGQSQEDVQTATSSADLAQQWPLSADTLPGCPARVPLRDTVSEELPGRLQPLAVGPW